jgi:hypothetical protein
VVRGPRLPAEVVAQAADHQAGARRDLQVHRDRAAQRGRRARQDPAVVAVRMAAHVAVGTRVVVHVDVEEW